MVQTTGTNVTTFFDLYAGVGGFRLPLENLGWKCVGYCEIDRYARITYEANFRTWNEYRCWDATKITKGELPNFDVLTAGFPCQSFSLAGKRLGFEDARGTLFFEIAKILEDKKPIAFLLENVKGLVQHDKGKTLETILSILKELGYDVYHEILNSKNFGVPQNRERIFFVGFKGNSQTKFEFPDGSSLTVKLKDVMEEKVPEKYYLNDEYSKKLLSSKKKSGSNIILLSHTKANIKERMQERDDSWTLDTSGNKIGIIETPKIKREGQINEGISGQVYSSDGIAPTIKSEGGGQGAKTGLYLEGERIRRLTPRECARLQGFPDSFKFPVSDRQAYRQIGNAVTVSVVEAIGKGMEKRIRCLKEKEAD